MTWITRHPLCYLDEKPAFAKSFLISLGTNVCITVKGNGITLDVPGKKQEKTVAKDSKVKYGRYTLDWLKFYLDSCVTYHTFFVRGFLSRIL